MSKYEKPTNPNFIDKTMNLLSKKRLQSDQIKKIALNCHQCLKFNSQWVITCSNVSCQISYCWHCFSKYFGNNVPSQNLKYFETRWICFSCSSTCTCKECQSKIYENNGNKEKSNNELKNYSKDIKIKKIKLTVKNSEIKSNLLNFHINCLLCLKINDESEINLKFEKSEELLYYIGYTLERLNSKEVNQIKMEFIKKNKEFFAEYFNKFINFNLILDSQNGIYFHKCCFLNFLTKENGLNNICEKLNLPKLEFNNNLTVNPINFQNRDLHKAHQEISEQLQQEYKEKIPETKKNQVEIMKSMFDDQKKSLIEIFKEFDDIFKNFSENQFKEDEIFAIISKKGGVQLNPHEETRFFNSSLLNLNNLNKRRKGLLDKFNSIYERIKQNQLEKILEIEDYMLTGNIKFKNFTSAKNSNKEIIEQDLIERNFNGIEKIIENFKEKCNNLLEANNQKRIISIQKENEFSILSHKSVVDHFQGFKNNDIEFNFDELERKLISNLIRNNSLKNNKFSKITHQIMNHCQNQNMVINDKVLK